MGSAPIAPLVFSMALPAVIANLTNSIYNITDRIFVGNIVGRNALGAIAVSFPLTNISAALSLFITTGGAAWLSMSLGKQHYTKANKVYSNMLVQSILTGLFLAVVYGALAPGIVRLCGVGPESEQYAMAIMYLRITAVGQLFHMLTLGLTSVIRAEGNTKFAMVVTMLGGSVNFGMNALFMLVFHWGLAGAAWGTVVGQVFGAILACWYFVKKKSICQFMGWKHIHVKWMLKIVSLGFAPSVLQGISFFTNILINNSLRTYANVSLGAGGGDLAISAYSIIHTVDSLLIMVVMGLNQGVSPIISYNYGKKAFQRVRAATLFGQCLATGASLVMWILMMGQPQWFFAIFGKGDTVLMEYGITAMKMSKAMVFVLGFQTLSSMYFSAIGKPKRAMLVSISRQGLFLIPFLLILPRLWGLNGVLRATAFSDACSVVLVGFMYFKEIRRLGHLIASEKQRPGEELKAI
jgi:putative MATE family efflux protein